MDRVTNPEIERLADLLRALPPAPVAWEQAAQELPLFRGEIDRIILRAEADAEFRRALIDDLEAALAGEGYVAGPAALEILRHRLAG
jgi:hypothetical protein